MTDDKTLYVLSISIDDPDPCERMIFSMVVDDIFLSLISNNNEPGVPKGLSVDTSECIKSANYDFSRLCEYDDLPTVYRNFVDWLYATDNWGSWMDDANIIAIGIAGFVPSVDANMGA